MIALSLSPEDLARIVTALRCFRHVPEWRALHERLAAIARGDQTP